MFCRNCGKEIPEGARFCSACGTSVMMPQPETENRDDADGTAVMRNGWWNRQRIIVGVIVVVVVVIVVIVLCASLSGGYKRTIRHWLKGFEEYDAETVLNTMAPFITEAALSEGYTWSELIAETQDSFYEWQEILNWAEAEVEDCEYSFGTGDVRDSNSSEINEVRAMWADVLDLFEVPQFKKMKVVDFDFTLKGTVDGQAMEETETITQLYVAKIGRKWYIVDNEEL